MDNGYPHHRQSLFGPIVLIAIGVLFLLRNRLPGFDAYRFLAHYWPALLIVWGLVRLVEHYTEPGSGGLTGGEVALLVVVVIFGLALTASLSFRHWHWNGDWQGGPPWEQQYHFHGASQAELPPGMPVLVRGGRASVELIATPGSLIRARVDDAVRAGSRARARGRFAAATLQMRAENGAWVVRPAGRNPSRRVSVRLRLYLPATTPATVQVRHGDLQAAGWRAALRLVSGDGHHRQSSASGCPHSGSQWNGNRQRGGGNRGDQRGRRNRRARRTGRGNVARIVSARRFPGRAARRLQFDGRQYAHHLPRTGRLVRPDRRQPERLRRPRFASAHRRAGYRHSWLPRRAARSRP